MERVEQEADIKKQLAVAVICKNVGIATRGDMIDCAGIFYAIVAP